MRGVRRLDAPARGGPVGRVLLDTTAQRQAVVSSSGIRVTASAHPDGLEQDTELLVGFLDGYARFSGDGDPLTFQQDYLAWLYISPFMSDLLSEGLRCEVSYPLCAVLMGKGSSGETTATRVFLRSTVGAAGIEQPG